MCNTKTWSISSTRESTGFEDYKGKSVDHVWLEFWHNGKMTTQRTKISHGSDKDLGDFHIKMMAKQTSMSKSFFIEFAKCSKSKDDYVKHLEAQNINLS